MPNYRTNRYRRRATALLLVVSLLALLFVIVSGFLAVTRFDQQISEQVSQGDDRETIVDNVEQMAIGMVGDSWRDDNGKVMGGPTATQATIPGYRGTHWLSSLEHVWNEFVRPTQLPGYLNLPGNWALLASLSLPAVSTFEMPVDGLPIVRSIVDLIPEFAWDSDGVNPTFEKSDIIDAARQAWMDADGDGVPDVDLLYEGAVGEIANALAGAPVRVPDPGSLLLTEIRGPSVTTDPDRRAGEQLFRRYLDNRRYDVAVRVIPHGGMVTLDAPTLQPSGTPPPWRPFQIDLFDAMVNPFDNSRIGLNSAAAQNRLFDELAAYAPAVEASLRNRFFLAPPMQSDNTVSVPPILAILQGDVVPPAWAQNLTFPETFIASLSAGGAGRMQSARLDRGDSTLDVRRKLSQRINLADVNGDLKAWAGAATLRPMEFNALTDLLPGQAVPPGEFAYEARYDRRHLITLHNNSDELMLKQGDKEPDLSATATPKQRLRTWRGEQKFYLGEINKAFVESAPGSGEWSYDSVVGHEIISQLARVYGDMLASTRVNSWKGRNGTGIKKQAVTQTEQAYMLAVNTVAFASPRDSAVGTLGWIDPVVFTDPSGKKYIGYAPQPHITEAIAYRNDTTSNDGRISIGIELFNPQDPYYDGAVAVDVFALNLAQYRFHVASGLSGGATWDSPKLFDVTPTMSGRSFLAFAIEEDSSKNNEFSTAPGIGKFMGADFLDAGVSVDTTANDMQIELQRQSKAGVWYTVDTITVNLPPNTGEGWDSVARDTTPTRYFGVADFDVDGTPDWARWNVVIGKTVTASGTNPSAATLASPNYVDSGVIVQPDTAPSPFAPTTPLITMNPSPSLSVPMFGNMQDVRPAAFPTVGFMLFIPRFAHMESVSGTPPTVGELLDDQWSNQSYNLTLSGGPVGGPSSAVPGYPADFGHMPIFNNRQPVKQGSYLDRVGAVPWGLLVFEYFTTLNPAATGVDPLKVPGRIDINAAPWYVLSKLPMIGPHAAAISGPTPQPQGGRLAIVSRTENPTAAWPSPSFWDPQVGVLVGKYEDPLDPGVTRGRLLAWDAPLRGIGSARAYPIRVADGYYQLGPLLAQAAGAYRDGVQYLDGSPSGGNNQAWVFADAHLRGGSGLYRAGNQTVSAALSYRPDQYSGNGYATGGIRGQVAPSGTPSARPGEFGFVTVGELLNVKGFDSTPSVELPPAQPNTNLTRLGRGDFVGAVSLLALLDTQYLVTRSNTFTVYASIIDRAEGQQNGSIRAQATIDRSNMLPRLEYGFRDLSKPLSSAGAFTSSPTDPSGRPYPREPIVTVTANGNVVPMRTENDSATPEVITRRRGGYFNTQYDN